MVSFRDIVSGLKMLDLGNRPVIAHVSLSSLGDVRGGAEILLGGLLASVNGLMMPAFTYRTMVTPEIGPADNGIAYGSGTDQNRMAEFFRPDLPVHPLMGVTAELLRRQPTAKRSSHPILSFTGVNVDSAIDSQTLQDPLVPLRVLTEQQGWVMLVGVNHTVNTSLHLAEKMAGRRQFIRWALTPQGARECPGFPGCSDGFDQIAPHLAPIVHQTFIGSARVQAIRLQPMLEIVLGILRRDPFALLCKRPDCERCGAVRGSLGTRLLQIPR